MGKLETYKNKFNSADKAEHYDLHEYKQNSYSSLIWEIEKRQIRMILGELGLLRSGVRGLDFACGTGRVTEYLVSLGVNMVGIDVSQSMVDLAKKRVPDSQIYQKDITVEHQGEDISYDVITAFRFLLNAEPSMRQKALKALSNRMNENTILIVNNHGNTFSHKIVFWPVHKLRSLFGSAKFEGNYLSTRKVRDMLRMEGLVIERQYGCGFLSGKFTRFISPAAHLKIEKRLARLPVVVNLCVNQMYLVRKIR